MTLIVIVIGFLIDSFLFALISNANVIGNENDWVSVTVIGIGMRNDRDVRNGDARTFPYHSNRNHGHGWLHLE